MTGNPPSNKGASERLLVAGSEAGHDGQIEHEKLVVSTRPANPEDVPRMLEIERERYEKKDKSISRTDEEIMGMFTDRLAIAGDWMMVVEVDGRVEGFTTGMLTDDWVDEFKSWEETTNDGTLEGVFDPEGDNVYVVNLDVSRKGTKNGAQYKLMAALGEKVHRDGKNGVMFISRMPGFQDYIADVEETLGVSWSELSDDEQDRVAMDYTRMRIWDDKKGKMVLRDHLLKFYEEDGFTFHQLIRDGFDDPESLNYGLVCSGDNFIPPSLRRNRLIGLVGGVVFRFMAENPKYIKYIIR